MTQDAGMDASPSWQALKEERDALEAHVERLAGAIMTWTTTAKSEQDAMNEAMGIVLDETPANSLANLKAQWQAEALEEVALEYRTRMPDPKLLCIIDAEILERRAIEIRSQAEGE